MAGGMKGHRGGAITHGHSVGHRSREYRAWVQMRKRCRTHPYYVARAIAVCARWQSFEAFLRDVGPAPSEKHTIDRWPNPSGNYEPGNVRWATMHEQRHNRRPGAKKRRSRLTDSQLSDLRARRAAGATLRALAEAFGISQSQACRLSRTAA